MTQIEKIARLMGYKVAERKPDFNYYHIDADTVGTFDPLSNKADLMDVECALVLNIEWHLNQVSAGKYIAVGDIYSEYFRDTQYFADHPDKFTARAHAVCAVAEQIYDKGQV